MNVSLLCKWWWKLEQKDGLWQEIVRKKYIKNTCISLLKKKPTNSPVWNQLLSVKDIYTSGRKMIVGKGDQTSFWRDIWVCDSSLMDKFPLFFEICNETEITVEKVASQGWQFSYRRWLNEDLQCQHRRLKDLLVSFAVNTEKDKPKWSWENFGIFSVKSTYAHLSRNELGAHRFGKQNFLSKSKSGFG